jgi:hypothetical protein
MNRMHTIIVVLATYLLAGCSGGGGGSKSVIGQSASFSSDGVTKTITTTYSDGTSASATLTGTPTTPAYSSDGSQKTLVYSFSDGTTHNGATLSGALTSTSYSADGSQKTPVYSFSDGTTHNGATLTGIVTSTSYSADGSQKTPLYSFSDGTTHNGPTLSGTPTTPAYSSDGSQKTLVYSFSDGTTHNGATLSGALTSTSYSADGSQEFKTFSFSDNTTYTATLQSIGSPEVSWASDHITKTITYTFADATTDSVVTTVQPATVVPVLTGAAYPSDWSSGTSTETVTKPTTSPKQDVYGDGIVKQVWEDGTTSKPFNQSTLTPNGATATGAINDPNAFVTAPTKGTYDLRWGTPDPAGPGYANNFNQGSSSYTLPTSTKIFDAVLSANVAGCVNAATNVTGCGPTLPTPSADIIDAWNKGWTGKGQNILIIDDIGASPISPHAATVETIAHRYAWGATFYGMTNGINVPTPVNLDVLNLDGTPAQPTAVISLSAINMSWGPV